MQTLTIVTRIILGHRRREIELRYEQKCLFYHCSLVKNLWCVPAHARTTQNVITTGDQIKKPSQAPPLPGVY